MRSFNEYHDVSFKKMEESEHFKNTVDQVFPMALLVDMEKIRKLTQSYCPQCGKHSFVIDHIEFKTNCGSVDSFHQRVSMDRVHIGGHYHVICGEPNCDFQYEEPIPVELFNQKPKFPLSWDEEDIEEEDIEYLNKQPSTTLIIENDLSQEEIEKIEKNDREYCEENDIEYDKEDLGTVINCYL